LACRAPHGGVSAGHETPAFFTIALGKTSDILMGLETVRPRETDELGSPHFGRCSGPVRDSFLGEARGKGLGRGVQLMRSALRVLSS